ncbi:FMN-dependent oxidoreductase, nitrilotriacetate monooxygenase family [Rhizobium sp. CF080]|uniref:LLM class flavin-dependent oxidoreductase n=1 Tax=Rhizobium sp. (strain CF080) TaxID=1144310 RepID=UPI00027177EB|nr:LLM class flavin-dependent oxidoreductase [Rhizobium sp. CF080]EUB99809.1 FMN-dependent oxidoreductase, nitrilotriacetate monooxygenase family [Rhizobium sp. CF080]
MRRKDKIKLNAYMTFTGNHFAAWRDPNSTTGLQLAHYAQLAKAAEEAKMDAVFLADGVSVPLDNPTAASRNAHNGVRPFEPVTLLSALSAVTSHIGLIATASTSFYEPYNLARLFGSLDNLSGGRAGWNLVTSADPFSALNFGLVDQPDHGERYVRAEEFADIVLGLWDSFEEDSFPRNRETGVYLDLDKVHMLNHHGKYYRVRGPLNLPRSPQGHPVVVQAGASEPGRQLAARTAEAIFSAHDKTADAVAFYSDLKGRMPAFGREADDMKIMTGFLPVIGSTQSEAEDRYARLQDLIDPEIGVDRLSNLLGGIDLRGYPIDGPLPDMPETNREKSRQALMVEMARRDNLTIRQLYQRVMGSSGHFQVIGTPEQIADAMEERFEAYGTDGFNVMSPVFPGDLLTFTTTVVPVLVRRGLFRSEYEGTTLRNHLGLKKPGNRFAA